MILTLVVLVLCAFACGGLVATGIFAGWDSMLALWLAVDTLCVVLNSAILLGYI